MTCLMYFGWSSHWHEFKQKEEKMEQKSKVNLEGMSQDGMKSESDLVEIK